MTTKVDHAFVQAAGLDIGPHRIRQTVQAAGGGVILRSSDSEEAWYSILVRTRRHKDGTWTARFVPNNQSTGLLPIFQDWGAPDVCIDFDTTHTLRTSDPLESPEYGC